MGDLVIVCFLVFRLLSMDIEYHTVSMRQQKNVSKDNFFSWGSGLLQGVD